jgi:hypothetical protein
MKILVACEESQAVCVAFRQLGHEAYSCDIQDQSGGFPDWHIKGDALKEAYSGKYDMMIAFPPCTYLSRAGAVHLYPKGVLNEERYKKALKAKEFFMSLYNAPIKHIAIENPTQFKVLNMPQYTQVIQPYMFGHPYSKRTLLWLKNLPHLKATKIIEEYTPFVVSSTHRGAYQPPTKTKKERSKTFSGIAESMANQWSNPKYTEQLSLF